MLLCGVTCTSDQAGILDDEEDQRKSWGTRIYETCKSIWSGKAILPNQIIICIRAAAHNIRRPNEDVVLKRNDHVMKVWLILDALAAKDQVANKIQIDTYAKIMCRVINDQRRFFSTSLKKSHYTIGSKIKCQRLSRYLRPVFESVNNRL
jgi:hypothetical protein